MSADTPFSGQMAREGLYLFIFRRRIFQRPYRRPKVYITILYTLAGEIAELNVGYAIRVTLTDEYRTISRRTVPLTDVPPPHYPRRQLLQNMLVVVLLLTFLHLFSAGLIGNGTITTETMQ